MSGTVFIVEDDPDFSMVLAEMLADEGFTPVQFSDGLQALRSLDRETPALIVTDLVMPGMSGAQLVRALRADERWREIPVVVVTGGTDMAAGAWLDAQVVYKPDVASLLSVLSAAARVG